MKKALTQTIIVFVAVNLITAGFALAQNAAEEESQPASKEAVVAEKEIELERKKAEIEAEVQKQVELVQKQVELQIPKIPAMPRVSIPLWQHSGGGAVLVIPAAQMKVEDLAAITEDMSVMSRIFDNKLSQADLTTGRERLFMGFDPLSFGRVGRGSGATEAIYLEGYGALFLMKVNFPLSSSPEAQQEEETKEEDTDPLWTQTRRQIYEPEEVTRRRRTERQEEKYDAEKVENLKETLFRTLKHAANIRALKPDQLVILTVIGERRQPATIITRSDSRGSRSRYGDSRSGRSSYITTTMPGSARTGFFSPVVLTIRAKKADIDAFAKGQLTFDQFHQKTLLLCENIGDRPSRFSRMGERSR